MLLEANIVREIAEVDQNLLSQWQGRGHVKPSKKADGQGTRNKYSETNICQILLFKELNEAGFTRSESSKLAYQTTVHDAFNYAMKELRSHDKNKEKTPSINIPLINVIFFRDKDGKIESDYVVGKKDFDALSDRISEARLAIVANLTYIANEVCDQIEAMDGGKTD